MNHLVNGKRYRLNANFPIIEYSSITKMKPQAIIRHTSKQLEICVLLEIIIIDEINLDIRVLLPDGNIGWIWTNRKNVQQFLTEVDCDKPRAR